jgi:hypothetical protein
MHGKAQSHSSIFGMRWSPASATLTIMLTLLFLLFLILFLTLTAPSAQGQTYKVIYNFKGGAGGARPLAGLTMDVAGNLYGTTVWGGVSGCDGVYGCGTVFKLTRTDTGWAFSRLYAFAWSDGAAPNSKLVFGPDGNLYGATAGGGDRGDGAVFGLTPQPASASVFGS